MSNLHEWKKNQDKAREYVMEKRKGEDASYAVLSSIQAIVHGGKL
jgi:hypothetical protein